MYPLSPCDLGGGFCTQQDPNTDKHQARQTFVAPPLVELLLQSDQCARIRSIDNIILNVLCRAKDMFKAEVSHHEGFSGSESAAYTCSHACQVPSRYLVHLPLSG